MEGDVEMAEILRIGDGQNGMGYEVWGVGKTKQNPPFEEPAPPRRGGQGDVKDRQNEIERLLLPSTRDRNDRINNKDRNVKNPCYRR
jgi:hypothetical protein